MPKKSSQKPPQMRRDREYAVVYLHGKRIFLGKWDSEESKTAYKRIVTEWVAQFGAGPVVSAPSLPDSATLAELSCEYLRWAKGYHETRTFDRFKLALSTMLEDYPELLVSEFGPKKLLDLQAKFVGLGYARTYCNKLVSCLRQVFSWGVSRELCSATVADALQHVAPLKKNKTEAHETKPREDVPDEIVMATLPYLLPTLKEMVMVQRLAGMRPSELWRMRSCDIDQSGEIWIYSPFFNKNEGKGCSRHIALGREEQEILLPRMAKKEPDEYLFSPKDTAAERNELRAAQRKTKVPPSQVQRMKERKKNPSKKWKDHYTTATYGQCLSAALEKIATEKGTVQKWTLYQLRHAFATETSATHDQDIARAASGHKTTAMTAIYDHADLQKSIEAAKSRSRKFIKDADEPTQDDE